MIDSEGCCRHVSGQLHLSRLVPSGAQFDFQDLPVKRKTDQVLISSSRPTYTSLRTFLEDHFEAETIPNLEPTHDPQSLFLDESTEPLQHSCEGSVEAHSGDLFRFRFSNQPKPSLLLEAKEKRKAETDNWVEE